MRIMLSPSEDDFTVKVNENINQIDSNCIALGINLNLKRISFARMVFAKTMDNGNDGNENI